MNQLEIALKGMWFILKWGFTFLFWAAGAFGAFMLLVYSIALFF
jgi:hypothetical protein